MKADELIQAIKAAVKEMEAEACEAKVHVGGTTPPKNDNDLMEIIKTRVTYEDVMHWIKKQIKPRYNGVYIHRSKARFFDKGDFSLKIFFAIDKKPQTGDDDPAIVYTYEKLDEALSDMLYDKDTILLKLNDINK